MRSDRHVPANAARRIRNALCAALVALCTVPAFAERAGTAAQIIKTTELRKGAETGSGTLGRLPRGTILTLTGLAKNGFVGVEVETEEGRTKGWVPRETLNKSAQRSLSDEGTPSRSKASADDEDQGEDEEKPKRRADRDEEEIEVGSRPRSRIRVPKDEGLLLHRDDSFYYGVQGLVGAATLDSVLAGSPFKGGAFGGGGHAGYIFSPSLAAQMELGYVRLSGSDPTGAVEDFEFGYFSIAATGVYYIDRFIVLAGLGYYNGLSLSNVPTTSNIGSAADLSSPEWHIGAGFRFPVGDTLEMSLEGRYTKSIVADPVGFGFFAGTLFLQFRG